MASTLAQNQAISASAFLNSMGINGDADAQTATRLAYLGIDHLRTSPSSVANMLAAGAYGAKIDILTPWFYHAINSSSLATMLQQINGAASVIEAVEGPNEVNRDPDTYNGLNGPASVEAEQKDLYALVKADPSLNNNTKTTSVYDFSVLPGTSPSTYTGMYNYADYNNVHAYGSAGVPPQWILPTTTKANTIAGSRPVIVTETGADTLAGSGVDQAMQARFDVEALLDDYLLGVKTTYLYSLQDWNTGSNVSNFSAYYGLYDVNGNTKLSGTAIHNMTSLLGSSTGAAASASSLAYSLSGMAYYGKSELLETTNGTFDLALWNETTEWNATTHTEIAIPTNEVNIQLGQIFQRIAVYDPLVSSNPIATVFNASSIQVALNADPLFVEFDRATPPAVILVTGVTGAAASGTGKVAGSGGVAVGGLASASGGGLASASVTQTGGGGGAGTGGASGGGGAASQLTNAVSGSTNGGTLSLTQIAIGGNGGTSDTGHGGGAGSAVSSLTFNDRLNPTASAAITANVAATGGNGGASAGTDGNGGFGNALANITGAGAVTLRTTATGGATPAGGGAGGTATATSIATGTQVNDTTTANAGIGQTIAATAYANAQATGTSGTISAIATTGLGAGNLIIGESAIATAAVQGTSNVLAEAEMGKSPPWWGVGAEASIDALPTAATLAPVLASAPNTQAVFGAGTTVLGIGQVGGGHSPAGTTAQTSTASADITLDRLQLAGTPDLFLSFYKAAASYGGVSDVSFNLSANGTTLLTEDFSSLASAITWFTDHPLDLGSLATGVLAQSATLDVHLGLSVTTTSGGAFSTGFLIGEAPASTHWPLA